jgi:hypothetical protein
LAFVVDGILLMSAIEAVGNLLPCKAKGVATSAGSRESIR